MDKKEHKKEETSDILTDMGVILDVSATISQSDTLSSGQNSHYDYLLLQGIW